MITFEERELIAFGVIDYGERPALIARTEVVDKYGVTLTLDELERPVGSDIESIGEAPYSMTLKSNVLHCVYRSSWGEPERAPQLLVSIAPACVCTCVRTYVAASDV